MVLSVLQYYSNKPSHSCLRVYTYAAMAVSFVMRSYSGTEGIGLHVVEVCVQIVLGSLDNDATVNLWTVSQSATGNVITCFTSFIGSEVRIVEHVFSIQLAVISLS